MIAPAALVALSLALPEALGATPEARTPAAQVEGIAATATLRFPGDLLAGFGLALEPAGDSIPLVAVEPAGFTVLARGDDFEGLASGSLRFSGGFVLRGRRGSVAIAGVVVRSGASPRRLAIEDARGEWLFDGERMHFDYDAGRGRLRLSEIDLVVSSALAERLGAPRLAGVVLGRLELEAAVVRAIPGTPGGIECSDPVWNGPVDVRLSNLGSVQQVARAEGRVAIAISAEIENVGGADVPWYRKFSGESPPYGNDQHPYLVWALYRRSPPSESGATSFEQIGRSALKHAFFSANTDCACAGGHILWAPLGGPTHDVVPCSDSYGTGSNDDPNALGPRDEVDPFRGTWTSRGSFFDADEDGICDWDTTGGGDINGNDCDDLTFSGPFDRRLSVLESELAVAGASYYVDAWYLVRGDVDLFDGIAWKQVAPSCDETSCVFPFLTALAPGSPLDAWVPHDAPPAGSSHVRVDSGAGRLSLAVRTNALGGGWHRYEYALADHDFGRRVRAIRVPLPQGVAVENAVFRTEGWTVTSGAGVLLFTADAPTTDALDWGELVSFGFDAEAAPAAGSLDLTAHEEAPGLVFAAPGLTPGGALGAALFQDGFEIGSAARWSQPLPP